MIRNIGIARFLIYITVALLAASCATSAPIAEPTAEPIAAAEPIAEPIVEEEPELIEIEISEPAVSPPPAEEVPLPFDPSSIPKEVFDSTKTDVQALIGQLNDLIREKDYEAWVGYLGAGYRSALSDPSFLERISSSAVLRKQNIVLRELRDYFIHVVVPSRTKDRVDDIEFIGQNRVKAFTVDTKGRRLRLYDLEKMPTGWKIIN